MHESAPTAHTDYRKSWYFFYGTLTNADFLYDLLKETGPAHFPLLHSARIEGYYYKTIRGIRFLQEGAEGQIVTGQATVIETKEQEERLKRYEGPSYRVEECTIHFQDGSGDTVRGCTFLGEALL